MYFQVYRNTNNAWYWRLRAANHKIVADSAEGYWNKSDCLAAINLVKAAYNAPVYEV